MDPKSWRIEKRKRKSEMKQARSSTQRSDNYDNKENHISYMLQSVILKFMPVTYLKHYLVALLKTVIFST